MVVDGVIASVKVLDTSLLSVFDVDKLKEFVMVPETDALTVGFKERVTLTVSEEVTLSLLVGEWLTTGLDENDFDCEELPFESV